MIKNYARNYDIAKRADRIVQVRNSVRQKIGWKPPDIDWVVVSTYGARTSSGRCGCGGVVRDSSGLRLAWRLGFRHVELRSDSFSVVKRLNNEEGVTIEGWSVLKHIRRLL
ncbi:hypothetical protein A2U01_0047468 [Trifolium medium]|uniref:RNase H type-1 domain-containing protein n=1 Tax=Trifolium medium TaxID=97028 RepID=A0A392QPF1_9FABA|nr:hypothetical protein [Trifolium medium]